MLSIGITGGTGCGKTALLHAVQSRGGAAVDCDALYYDLLRTDETLRTALTDAFGEVFLSSGSLDRQKLAAIVFSDARQLTRLNKIVFFHIRRAAEQLQHQAEADGRALFAIDAINLIESGLSTLCTATVAVLAPENVRLARIMARDHIDKAYAQMRIRAQKPDDFYRLHCKYILENGENAPDAFLIKANHLLDQIIKENST